MTDFTTMSYNKIRDLAKAQGFEGANPKRADLVAFLEALESPTLAETIDAAAEALAEDEPVTTEEIRAALATVEAAAKAQLEKEGDKAEKTDSKTEKKSDKIAARRASVAEVVKEIFEENAIAMNWGGVVQKYEAKLGVKHDRVIWHDIGHAIRALCDSGEVKVHNPDKGRTTYQRSAL